MVAVWNSQPAAATFLPWQRKASRRSCRQDWSQRLVGPVPSMAWIMIDPGRPSEALSLTCLAEGIRRIEGNRENSQAVG